VQQYINYLTVEKNKYTLQIDNESDNITKEIEELFRELQNDN
tara:strand:- start:6789 stop:6914 length:126 start_codon:yes stop_codon:yes gene_type:complete